MDQQGILSLNEGSVRRIALFMPSKDPMNMRIFSIVSVIPLCIIYRFIDFLGHLVPIAIVRGVFSGYVSIVCRRIATVDFKIEKSCRIVAHCSCHGVKMKYILIKMVN
jgi:hypothetical protein